MADCSDVARRGQSAGDAFRYAGWSADVNEKRIAITRRWVRRRSSTSLRERPHGEVANPAPLWSTRRGWRCCVASVRSPVELESCRDSRPTSLPLDRRRRLRGDVVDDAVDAPHLVDDPARDAREQLVRQLRPVGGHPVHALHRAHRDDLLVGALVAHHADASAPAAAPRSLPEFVRARLARSPRDDDRVGRRSIAQPLARDLAEDAHAEARAGERLPPDDLVGTPSARPSSRTSSLNSSRSGSMSLSFIARAGRRRCGGS